jgi:membrane fusion protein (multidrug efflux system)
MKKRIFLALVGLLAVIGVLAGIKVLQIRKMIAQGAQFVPPPTTVNATAVRSETWESLLAAVGSLTAVQGVTVAAELPGKVVKVDFAPGTRVNRGDLLLQQDVSTELAQLPGTEAGVVLARANLERARNLLAQKFVSQAEYDAAVANTRQAEAAADSIRAAIAKKTIRAPFAGRLGIRLVNLGQILREGDAIVSLQDLDPIFVEFLLPQQQLSLIRPGLPVRVTSDALPGATMTGKITAINPEIDAATRNIRVQATLPNPEERLRPGMFVKVALVLPVPEPVLVIPATAVLYATYSNSVFVVTDQKDEATGKTTQVLRQQIVQLGGQRGDFVAVSSGLKVGETVVTTGVFKLRNGQPVVVDNTLAPEFKLAPQPRDD